MIKVYWLEDESGGGVWCPVLCCDSCGEDIEGPMDGIYLWYGPETRASGEKFEVFAAHMGTCGYALRMQKGWPEQVSSSFVGQLPQDLAANLGITNPNYWEAAKRKAAALGEVYRQIGYQGPEGRG